MPPIELGPARPVGAIEARLARQPGVKSEGAGKAQEPKSPVAASHLLDPGEAPVDAERVQVIRKAIESGTYPIVPARIADAMIAAGLLLRSGAQ